MNSTLSIIISINIKNVQKIIIIKFKNTATQSTVLDHNPAINGTPVAGSHARPAIRLATVNLDATLPLVIT